MSFQPIHTWWASYPYFFLVPCHIEHNFLIFDFLFINPLSGAIYFLYRTCWWTLSLDPLCLCFFYCVLRPSMLAIMANLLCLISAMLFFCHWLSTFPLHSTVCPIQWASSVTVLETMVLFSLSRMSFSVFVRVGLVVMNLPQFVFIMEASCFSINFERQFFRLHQSGVEVIFFRAWNTSLKLFLTW